MAHKKKSKKKKKGKKKKGECGAGMSRRRVKRKGGKSHMQCVLMKGHKPRKKRKKGKKKK